MLPNFVGTTHVVLPSAGNGTFWDAPGGSGAVAPDVVASPAPARDVSTPWPLNTPDLAVLGPEHFALHDECSNAPENQIGWRRMLRPGAGVFVSSWGRAISGLALTRLAGSQSLDIDRAFDSQQPVSMYIKQVGNTSSTPVSLVFETWWQYGVIKLSRLLANHPRAQHIPAPVLDEWFPAKFDANPQNTMAHNMVPWPLGSEVPATGVDTRFVARYAQQNRRAWAHCLLVADTLLRADPGGVAGGYQVAALAEAFGLTGTTRELGVFRLNLLTQGGAPTLDAPLPTEFVLNCPALPLAFFTWHDRIEDQHAGHVMDELEELYFTESFDEAKFIAGGRRMLDGVGHLANVPAPVMRFQCFQRGRGEQVLRQFGPLEMPSDERPGQ